MIPAIRFTMVALVVCALTACWEDKEDPSHVGYVEAEWRYISAPESGWLVSRPVREGDQISVGDLLFGLDSEQEQLAVAEAESRVAQAEAQADDLATGARPAEIRALQAQLVQAEAALFEARSERDRILPLVERGLEPARSRDQAIANFDLAEAAVEAARENINVARLAARQAQRDAATAQSKSAEATRAAAEVRLGKRSAYAAMDGVVTEVFHYEGEYVTAGSPVLAVQPANSLKVRFFIAQRDLPRFALGKRVRVRADGLAEPVTATVSYIATEAEFTPPVIYSRSARDKLVFVIEATLPEDTGLLPGLAVDIDWS